MTLLRRLLPLVLAAASAASSAARAERLHVAAAANLAFALDDLHAAFHAATPGVELIVTTAASGHIVAQVERGAPFHVFLSADLDYPRELVARDLADPTTLTPFATGRLVWWTRRPGPWPDDLPTVLGQPRLRRLALAQPDHAPYGRAAQETLQALGRWESLRPRLIIADSVSQAAQFVSTGNADAGFVALSAVLATPADRRGHWIEVPASLHAPLTQGAILTRRGTGHAAARTYLAFLLTPAAQAILARHGYAPPAAPPPP